MRPVPQLLDRGRDVRPHRWTDPVGVTEHLGDRRDRHLRLGGDVLDRHATRRPDRDGAVRASTFAPDLLLARAPHVLDGNAWARVWAQRAAPGTLPQQVSGSLPKRYMSDLTRTLDGLHGYP